MMLNKYISSDYFRVLLSGGDPRSLGQANKVLHFVLNDQKLLDNLFACVLDDDEIVRMRAGDVLEKVCAQHPDWLSPYIPRLFDEVAVIKQASIQWHLAQMFGELELAPEFRARAIKILFDNLSRNYDWIVTNFSMETLALFGKDNPDVHKKLLPLLRRLSTDRHKSIASRAKKLVLRLGDNNG
ncbi:MAG TPA: hypothetical protein VLG25_03160 [Patescibacteria group bacterium]|nr:hypothetical protein [Patescibacteria group bacterium]